MIRTFTLLGTGSSGGVPRVGNQWGACDPDNPKNRRRRCALLVEQRGPADCDATTVLIDAGADLREQMLASGVTWLDGVMLTHPHADHIFGLDDLRQLAMSMRKAIDVWLDASTSATVMRAFGYCFYQEPGSSYPSFCRERRIEHPQPFEVKGRGAELSVRTILAEHGDIHSLGYRIGNVAYLPDVKRVIDATSLERLQGLDVLIIDALRYRTHPAHLGLDEALVFIEQLQPGRAILTNMHTDLDYEALRASLPAGVEPGYDGLKFQNG